MMRIKSISTANFGKLANEKVTFTKGLTVIKGPNEVGKSFSIEAITQGLYGDASSSAAFIQEHCRKWGSEGVFSLELEIESGGKKYRIIRDFENKKNILVKPDGTEIKDKETVRTQIARLVGLPSEIAFTATACIPQEEVERVRRDVSSLREIIEGRLGGSGTDTDKIVKKINIAKEKILSRSGKKGDLVHINSQIEDTEQGLSIKQERLIKLTENKEELDRVNQKKKKDSQALEDKGKAYQGSLEYITAKERFKKAEKAFDSAQGNLTKYKTATKKIQNAVPELEKLQSKLGSLGRFIEQAEALQESNESCRELEKKLSEFRNKIFAVNKLENLIKEKQKEIQSYKSVDYATLQNMRNIPGEIKGLRSSLAEQLFGIQVKLEKDIEYSIIADSNKVKGPIAEMHEEAIVRFPGIASVQIRNLTGEEMPIVDEIKRKEEVLNQEFKQYGVKDIDELEKLHKKREKAINERDTLKMKVETLLDEEDLSDLNTNMKELEKEFKKENTSRVELKSFAMSPAELKKKNEDRAELGKKKSELEIIIMKNKYILEAAGSDENELNKLKQGAAKELAISETKLDESKIFECSPENFIKLKRETEKLKEAVKELNSRQIKLYDRVEQETLGAEDIASLEENLSELGRRRARLDHKYRVLDIINDNITWARESAISQFSEGIEAQMSKILSQITDGRYKQVKVDENLGVSVYSSEKGEFINIDDKIDKLSSGTIDQVYLAARLAILELIATGEKPPLILDDTFVNYDDMGRKERAFKMLESIAMDYQVLYFTCHHCPEGLKVIELA